MKTPEEISGDILRSVWTEEGLDDLGAAHAHLHDRISAALVAYADELIRSRMPSERDVEEHFWGTEPIPLRVYDWLRARLLSPGGEGTK